MEEKDLKKEESNIEIRKTFSNLIKEELPEMTQEEAIENYREDGTIRPKKNGEEDDNTEESEHLKRIKKELLASLERVKQLAKKIYGEENKNKLNVKTTRQKSKQKSIDSKESEAKKDEKGRERE